MLLIWNLLHINIDILCSFTKVLCILVLGLSTGSPICASFTSDGKHILSACDDSNVYLWNVSQDESNPMKAKKIRSCERFFSNASVAVPWHGLKSRNIGNEHQLNVLDKKSSQVIRLNPPASFSLSQEFFLESFPKGSATWPEENLPVSSPKGKTSMMHKSDYKFLKSSCKSTSSAHSWGMVIVTAGWDGRIKAFHNYGLPIPVWNEATFPRLESRIKIHSFPRRYCAWKITCRECSWRFMSDVEHQAGRGKK